ncbi:MAG: nucleotide exchange factor GrpE, partial [Gammaproteobacteria bacterium]|nr:nucleotide exchange factor GrpE [Gammaproteobacteria bacterium]
MSEQGGDWKGSAPDPVAASGGSESSREQGGGREGSAPDSVAASGGSESSREQGGDREGSAPESAAASSGSGSSREQGDDWKRSALEDFRRWLDELGEDAPDPGDDTGDDAGDRASPECDLHDLFAELAALRQEIRLQNREQSRAGREFANAADRYDAATGLMRRHEEDLAAFEKRIAREAENRCLRSVLEVRDALVRGREAATALRERPGLFRRPPRGVAAVVEGYEMALRRFDRMLARFGVRRLPATGHPFDSRTMHAMEV